MRSIVVRALALLLVPLSVMVAPTADAGDPVKILIFGDSITQGSSGDWTWRYFLDRHLHEVGVPFDFVGPRDGLHHVPEVSGATFPDEQTYADPAFDTDHAAVWGQALTSPVEDAGDLAATYQPDVVVAMMGLNDLLWQGDAVGDLIAQWRSDIAALREANPGVRVVLVQLPQTWHPAVVPYDAALVDLAAELDTPSSRVAATPLPAFDVDVDTWDGNHPSASGDVKIAVAVESALFKIGVSPPAGMVPVAPNGPRSVSALAASPGIGSVTLTWSDVAGVTREWLEQRDATADGRWSRYPYPFNAGTRAWAPTGLVDGHRYEFRLRPAKGTAMSADVTSPVVSVVPGPRPPAPALRAVRTDAGGRLSVSWAAAPDATAYAVQLRDATRREGWRPAASTASTFWSVGGLVSGHAYEIRVRADNGIIEGATSPTATATVPVVDATRSVRARSPRRDRVRTSAAAVRFATGYRVLVAPARACRRQPAASAFRAASADVRTPATTITTRSRALWVRWYAVRDGVAGRLAATSTTCTRVR